MKKIKEIYRSLALYVYSSCGRYSHICRVFSFNVAIFRFLFTQLIVKDFCVFLIFVRGLNNAGTTKPTSFFLLSLTVAWTLFSQLAFKKSRLDLKVQLAKIVHLRKGQPCEKGLEMLKPMWAFCLSKAKPWSEVPVDPFYSRRFRFRGGSHVMHGDSTQWWWVRLYIDVIG